MDVVSLAHMKPQWMLLYLFLFNGICKHSVKCVKSVISIPEYTERITWTGEKPSQAFICKFYLFQETRACQFFIKKGSVEAHILKISLLLSHFEWGKSEVMRHFLLSSLSLSSAAIQCSSVFKNHGPYFLISSSIYFNTLVTALINNNFYWGINIF